LPESQSKGAGHTGKGKRLEGTDLSMKSNQLVKLLRLSSETSHLGSVPLRVTQTSSQKSPPSRMNACLRNSPMWLMNGVALIFEKVILR